MIVLPTHSSTPHKIVGLASCGLVTIITEMFCRILRQKSDFSGDFQMKPKSSIFTSPTRAIPATRAKLVDLVHPSHPLVSLAREMNWPEFDLQGVKGAEIMILVLATFSDSSRPCQASALY
jgi:hypothetical protein